LAALSGVLLGTATKARDLVSFGSVMWIHVESEGATINAYPVEVGGSEVVLATLSVGPGPNQTELKRVFENRRSS
jgi:hypothetical protein